MDQHPSYNIRYYGRPEPLPEQVALRAGPLSLVYEAGDLRYIRAGDNEILRRIYAAVRDHNWNTIPSSLSNIRILARDDSFEITYEAAHQQKQVDFAWQGTITGAPDGTITFSMRGKARTTFRRNRIGFCVLHPMACAGAQVKIEHVDGTIEDCAFPTSIAPQMVKDGHPWPVAPFDNLRSLSHQVQVGVWAELRFEGDVFEMEDQRNWTDASFKTYCTPLDLPFPVEIQAGTEIKQSICLKLSGRMSQVSPAADQGPITLSILDRSRVPLPMLGLGTASHGEPLQPKAIERLRTLHLSHLRVDLRLSGPTFTARLRQAGGEARAIGSGLEAALFLSDEAENELANLAACLREVRPPALRWLIFHQKEKTTAAHWIDLARRYLSKHSRAPIGAGSNAYFTQINAAHPPVHAIDFITYSINPQVHAFDNTSLTEALAGQAETLISTRGFAEGKPVIISPVTLKPRFNPNATGPDPQPAPGELPAQVDERQSSLYGLAWTLGSLKYLAGSGASSITYYETTGWRGIMAQESGPPLPELFFSIPGGVYPIYHLFSDLAEFSGAQVIPLRSSRPLSVDGLFLERGQKRMLLLANFTSQDQPVQLDGLPSSLALRRIHTDNILEAMRSPEDFRAKPFQPLYAPGGVVALSLKPFETARIDL